MSANVREAAVSGIFYPKNSKELNLNIESLLHRLNNEPVKEIIMALSTTMEGDTTVFYLYKKISQSNREVKLSSIARGVSIGDDLEYADEVTLGRSILNRTPYENMLKS